ncbi:MAG: cyclase family protein [Candidatus Wildermuthbacteria bacterium]|nr:cyclase family protein [Candidatus Wildermuthbacteria bacterium]
MDHYYIDLSYPIEEGMLTFDAPWHSAVSIRQMGRIDVEGRESRMISFGSHTGTHIDAPLHFLKKGKSIDTIPLNRLIGKVVFADFSHLKENEQVTKAMLESFEIGERMIFRFGWGKFWGEKKFYAGYPFFSAEAAEYLVSRGAKLIGYDTPSPDDSRIELKGENLGSDRDSPIHKLFLKHGIILIEYVANLQTVEDLYGWNIIALPLRITGGDGSPARVCVYK